MRGEGDKSTVYELFLFSIQAHMTSLVTMQAVWVPVYKMFALNEISIRAGLLGVVLYVVNLVR